MAYGIIYEVLCILSGKKYVGQTTLTLQTRWAKHIEYALKRGGSTHFAAAIRKHGVDQFVLRVIEECPNRETLDARETYWIAMLETLTKGYNHTSGGEVREWSPESRRKFSEHHPLRGKIGPEHPAFGYRHTEEAKQRIAKSSKGRQHSEKTKALLSEVNSGEKNPRFGRPPSEATRRKQSDTLRAQPHHLRGKKHPPEMIERLSQAHAGHTHSDESKAKIAGALKGKPKTPEHRARLSEAAQRWRTKKKQAQEQVNDQTGNSGSDEVS